LDIIIIAADDDLHAQCVAQVIRKDYGNECLIWDSSGLPAEDRATIELGNKASECSLISNGCRYNLDQVKSIWWRRPQPPRISQEVSELRVRDFCQEETSRFFKGWATLASTTLINEPDAQERANRKAVQLQLARRLGMRIPETIMTNDADAVRQFVQQLNCDCVYKTLRSPRWQMVETRLLQGGDLERLDVLRHAPVIVQRYIPRRRDIRAMVIEDKIFCASATVRREEAEVDWRVDPGVKWQASQIPENLETLLVTYVAQLKLHYGCIDLREDPQGEIYFLELNPAGQFLFLEVDAGLPVLSAFAAMLCER
jgi:hypothetical protein